jgi:DNA repair exonuclease SbcCD ATPase subunit
MLHTLKKKFSRVLIISHKPQINEIIERKIIIEKDAGDFGMSEIKRVS